MASSTSQCGRKPRERVRMVAENGRSVFDCTRGRANRAQERVDQRSVPRSAAPARCRRARRLGSRRYLGVPRNAAPGWKPALLEQLQKHDVRDEAALRVAADRLPDVEAKQRSIRTDG